MNNKTLLLLFAAAATAAPAFAGTGAAWLAYPSSARNVAEAGGLGVMADGLQSLGLNPAGLATGAFNGEAQISHSSWGTDISAEHVAGSFKVGQSRLAVGGSWVDFGAIQGYRYDAVLGNIPEGQLRPSAGALGLSLARQFGSRVEAGFTGQWLMQDLTGGGPSSAAAFDMGLRSRLAYGFNAGLSLVHLGSSLDGSDLPTAVKMGLAFRSDASRLEAGVEGNRVLGSEMLDVAGVLRLHLGEMLVARAGWLQLSGQATQPSFGASFKVKAWTLDYAYRSNVSLGPSHHIGVEYQW